MRVIFCIMCCVLFGSSAAWANRDSIGVRVIDRKYFIEHKVTKGEGLYALSRRYGVSVSEIQEANPDVGNGLALDQIILVPYEKAVPPTLKQQPQLTKTPPEKEEPVKPLMLKRDKAVTHSVQAGETLYRIATNYKVRVEELQAWNHLSGSAISVGQELIVGKVTEQVPAFEKMFVSSDNTPEQIKPEDTAFNPNLVGSDGDFIADKYRSQYNDFQLKLDEKQKTGKVEIKEVEESGVASWIDDGSVVSEKSLALHRTAPPGTIMRITNPMNNKVMYVKVIASLPRDTKEDNVVIKITKTTADKLGVRDKFFRLDMHYRMEIIK